MSVTIPRLALPAVLLALLAAAPTASAESRSVDRTWHGKQINAYDAMAAGHFGRGVVVAVLDGWVDRSHPDFEGRVRAGADCTSGVCRAGQGRDACTHGTHVAGTVASSSFGVAPEATVLPVRVLVFDPGADNGKGECTGTPTAVAAGVRWAVSQGAAVLNLSLGPGVPGLGSSSEIPTAVHEAAAAGIVVIFSAGNADLPTAQAYGSDALVVAATGPSGRLATYSQHGQGVSLAAPGGQPDAAKRCTQDTCVTSLYPGGGYAVAAGTSMAAPHVTGIAALLLGQQPRRGRQSVIDRLTRTAHPLAGAGAGLVDAKAALGLTSPAAKPVTSRPAAPAPIVKVSPRARPTTTPTALATPAAPTPSTVVALPPPAARPSRATAPPVVEAIPVTVHLRLATYPNQVPMPLAAFGGLLIGLAGTGVLTLSRLPKR